MSASVSVTHLSDEVHAVLSTPHGTRTPTVPQRPPRGADPSVWVDYVVSLGADRGHVLTHLTEEQLPELADRLGG